MHTRYFPMANFYHRDVLYQRQLVDHSISQCLVHMQITARVWNNSKMRTRTNIERDNRNGISVVIRVNIDSAYCTVIKYCSLRCRYAGCAVRI